MKNFTPKLFVGIGETGAFFTLRETYEHKTYSPGEGAMGNAVVNGVYQGSCHTEIWSFHHFNLSQDADEAFEKAVECSHNMGLELISTREELDFNMREIKRATAAELEERKAREERMKQEWEEQLKVWQEEKIQKIADGIYPIGAFIDKKFEEASVGYINWLINKVETFDAGSILQLMAQAVKERCSHLMLPVAEVDKVVGQPKQRLEFNVTVTRVASFPVNIGYVTEMMYITTMVTDDKVCLVCKSSSFRADVGEKFKMKATVKEHGEYQGQAQTVVQRITIVE